MRKLIFALTAGIMLGSSASALAIDDIQDISPTDAYNEVTNPYLNAFILDVRTREEWGFVGHPAPDNLGQGAELEGKIYNVSLEVEDKGQMVPNKWFLEDTKALFNKLVKSEDNGDSSPTIIIVMCRSGHRSATATAMMVANGFTEENGFVVKNMVGGFEGARDEFGYRDVKDSGWKNQGLPYLSDCDGRGYVPRSVPHDSLNK